MRRVVLGLLLLTPSTAWPQPAGDILPSDRRTAWNPGIPGGIPVRTSVCANINAAAHGNGLQDATDAIQASLDSCPAGQVVQLSAGNFKITSALRIPQGIVLRGQGPALTMLKMPSGTNSNVVTVGEQWYPRASESVNLASDAVKGAFSVTLASDPGLTAGEVVVVDQITNPFLSKWNAESPPGDPSREWFTRMDRPLGQVMEIASVSGDTVTFTTPFHIDYQTVFTAQLWRLSAPVIKYAGVEDLYASGGSGGQGNIWLHGAYLWARNVESDYQVGPGVSLDGCFRCVLRDSLIHSAQESVPGGGAYGIAISLYTADSLIENNIVWNMNKVMVMRATGGGNVIGYNYMEDGWIEYAADFLESGLNASHMTTAHYELFEGNQSFNFDGDGRWGGAVYITAFRNHLTGKRRSVWPLKFQDAGNPRAISLADGHWWYSFVGNVLGTPGQDPAPLSGYIYEGAFPWDDDPVPMWKLGYSDNWGPADPKVLSTVLRDGNFEYVTNEVRWHGIGGDVGDGTPRTIPDSLYLVSKPAFFGDYPWPWVDPTGTIKTHTLPARVRFDAWVPPVPPPAAPGSVIYRSHSLASYAPSGTSAEVARPGGTEPGDLLLAVLTLQDSPGGNISRQSVTWPADFVQLADAFADGAAKDNEVLLAFKVAQPSEPASYQASWSPSLGNKLLLVAIAGADSSRPLLHASVAAHEASTTESPSVEAFALGLLVVVGSNWEGGGWHEESGNMSARSQLGVISLFDQPTPTAGPTGTRTLSGVSSRGRVGISIAVGAGLGGAPGAPGGVTVTIEVVP